MSETGIENEREYRVLKRVEGGVHLLVWVLVYAFAVAILLCDLLIWRPW